MFLPGSFYPPDVSPGRAFIQNASTFHDLTFFILSGLLSQPFYADKQRSKAEKPRTLTKSVATVVFFCFL